MATLQTPPTMSNLPQEVQQRIVNDGISYAESSAHKMVARVAYTTGAIAEAEKAQVLVEENENLKLEYLTAKNIIKQLQCAFVEQYTALKDKAQEREKVLVEALEKILHAPVPANDREYMSWFVTAKNVAGGAISEWEAAKEVASYTHGKGGGE